MGKKGRGRGRPPVRGFRPGHEPAHLRKRRAKAELGPDASWAQKQMIDTIGDRSPAEVDRMMKRWSALLVVAAVLFGVGGAFVYRWSLVAGIVLHLLTLGLLFLWWRVRGQRRHLVAMAESIGGGPSGGGARGGRGGRGKPRGSGRGR